MTRDPLLPEEYGRPRLLVLAGIAILAVAAAFGVPWTVRAWLDRAPYLRATPCSETVRRDCVVDRRATVTAYRVTGGRSRSHEVTFAIDGRETTEELADPDEVWGVLRRGMEVDVRTWNGTVTRVGVAGRATETTRSPQVASLEGTGFVLGGTGVGLALLRRGLARLRWRRLPLGPLPENPRYAAAYAMTAAGIATLLLVVGFDVFDPLPVLAVAGVAAVVPYVVLRAER